MRSLRILSAAMLAAVLAAFAVPSLAQTYVIHAMWSPPATYTDGSPLLPTDLDQTRLVYGPCMGSGTSLTLASVTGQWIVPGGLNTGNSPGLNAGTYCVQAYTTAKNVESAPSNVLEITLGPVAAPQSAPNPPTLNGLTLVTP